MEEEKEAGHVTVSHGAFTDCVEFSGVFLTTNGDILLLSPAAVYVPLYKLTKDESNNIVKSHNNRTISILRDNNKRDKKL